MKKIIPLLLIAVSNSLLAQEDFVAKLKKHSENYYALFNRVKLELIFNQPKYATGDTVLFRAKYLNARDLSPVKGRQIVHICFFDQAGKKVLTRWASIEDGLALNEMVIPDNFQPGNYILVAFTDWMKNFDKSLFFRQQFKVVGRNSINVLPPKDTIAVYTEGGSLVKGLESNIAFRYIGKQEKIKVTLRDSNKELRSFIVARDSVNTVKFTPTTEDNYYIESPDLVDKYFLPKVQESGVSLIAAVVNQSIKINLEISEKNVDQKNDLYLLAYDNSGLQFSSRVDFSGGAKIEIQLPQNLRGGIAQLILTDSKFNIWAERVIYIGELKLRTTKVDGLLTTYGTRSPVKFNLKIQDNYRLAYSSRIISCSVYNNDFLSETNTGAGYINFKSDIDNSFDLQNKSTSSQVINNYLITQHCPWFDWRRITSKEKMKPLYETQQFQMLSGKAVYSKNRLPVRDSTLLMFFLQKSLRGYETYAMKNGQFLFPLVLNVNSNDRFFYAGNYKGKDSDDIQLKIDDPDSLISFSSDKWMVDNYSSDSYGVFHSQKKAIQNSYAFFERSKPISDSTYDANRPIEEELNEADVTVYLKDYLMMPSMEEVVREILRSVEYRKSNGRDVIRVYTTTKIPSKYAGPLYVIDGVLTKDVTQFMSLKPSDIVYIKVVRDNRKLFAMGQLGVNGVIIVKTKNDFSIQVKNQFHFSGLLPQRNSLSQNPFKLSPSFSSCIFWNPNLKIDENDSAEVSFMTTDDIGNFKIVISGETNDGTPIYSEYPLSISLKK